MEPPYYPEKKADTLVLVPGGIRTGTLEFVRAGPSASEAFQPGSELFEWMKGIGPEREYMFMSMDAHSFETVRAVRTELRKRGMLVGWEPDEKGNEDVSIVHGVSAYRLPPVQ